MRPSGYSICNPASEYAYVLGLTECRCLSERGVLPREPHTAVRAMQRETLISATMRRGYRQGAVVCADGVLVEASQFDRGGVESYSMTTDGDIE